MSPRPADPPRIPELDGVRGVAVLMVLYWHLLGHFVRVYVGERFAPDSWAFFAARLIGVTESGVDLFFVLSGFLIGGIILDHRDAPAGGFYSTFYVRRTLRILPVYYLLLVVFAVVTALGDPGGWGRVAGWMAGSPDPIPGWSYFAHVQNIYIAVTATVPPMALGITWSLAVEEQFYLLFPPILRRLPAGSLPLVVGSLVLLAIPVRMSFETFPARHALLPCRMDSLMVGVLAALVVRQPGLMARLRENRAAVGFLGAVLLFGSFALALRPPASWAFGVLVLDPTWVAAMYGVFLLRLRLAPEGPAAALMRWAPLRWLGLISYPVYLFHGIIHDAVIRGMVASLDWSAGRIALAGAATSFTLTLLLSWALHRLVERPLIAVGHSFRYPARPE